MNEDKNFFCSSRKYFSHTGQKKLALKHHLEGVYVCTCLRLSPALKMSHTTNSSLCLQLVDIVNLPWGDFATALTQRHGSTTMRVTHWMTCTNLFILKSPSTWSHLRCPAMSRLCLCLPTVQVEKNNHYTAICIGSSSLAELEILAAAPFGCLSPWNAFWAWAHSSHLSTWVKGASVWWLVWKGAPFPISFTHRPLRSIRTKTSCFKNCFFLSAVGQGAKFPSDSQMAMVLLIYKWREIYAKICLKKEVLCRGKEGRRANFIHVLHIMSVQLDMMSFTLYLQNITPKNN